MSVLQPRIWGPTSLIRSNTLFNAPPYAASEFALNDSNNAYAAIFAAPKSGNISSVGIVVTGVTGTPPNYSIALVTLDASGNPTTTPVGTSEVETLTVSGTGYQTVTLAPAAAVTAGDIVAVHVWPTAPAPDAGNCIGIAYGQIGTTVITLPCRAQYTTSWARSDRLPVFSVTYDDGAIYGAAITAYWAFSFDSASDPDEIGMKITLPMACKCCGALVVSGYIESNAGWSVCLYSSAGSLLGSWTCSDKDYLQSASGTYHAYWAEQTLAPGDYYVTVRPNGSANYVIVGYQFPSAALRAACLIPEAANVVAVSRTDGGAWTEDDTAIPWMGLLLSEITFSGDGSSGPRWL